MKLKRYIILLFLLGLQSSHIKTMRVDSEAGDGKSTSLSHLRRENSRINIDLREVFQRKLELSSTIEDCEKELESLASRKRSAKNKLPCYAGGILLGGATASLVIVVWGLLCVLDQTGKWYCS